ncbi:MAG TPA: tripartite tricarboxylate transporter substrate binding protein [Burkholderiales bacterium]
MVKEHSKRIILIAAFFAAAIPAAQFAAAQTGVYPNKPVHVILPFPPGGSVDTVARLLVPRLSESLGQQFLIENRSGASGNIGTEYVARAAPDGYTLMVNTIPFVANSYMYAKLPFDPLTDFVPISLLCSSPSVLVVHPSLPVRSVPELLDLARSKPGVLNFATAGPGTNPHIAGELFNYLGKVNIVAIHYKGGGPALMSTIAGDTEIIVSGVSESTPFATSGKLRALGITSLARSPAFPDIPTIAESGLPGYEFVTWHGLLAPRGTSGAIVALLNERVKKTMATPEQVRIFRQNGQDIIASTPEEFAAHLKKESARWGRVIKEQGMRAE